MLTDGEGDDEETDEKQRVSELFDNKQKWWIETMFLPQSLTF